MRKDKLIDTLSEDYRIKHKQHFNKVEQYVSIGLDMHKTKNKLNKNTDTGHEIAIAPLFSSRRKAYLFPSNQLIVILRTEQTWTVPTRTIFCQINNDFIFWNFHDLIFANGFYFQNKGSYLIQKKTKKRKSAIVKGIFLF